ncbi:MAG: acetate--CoA ligase family protein [Thermoplasmata archaeon]
MNEPKKVMEEFEVKEMLKKYGIRVPNGMLISNLPENINLDYPLVLKVSDPNILHNSVLGGVALNIKNYDELKIKFNEMKNKFPDSKFLVESMEKSGVEIIVGLIKDKTFVLSIMFGMGGIFTELYRDVSFRLVPIEEFDAREMIE